MPASNDHHVKLALDRLTRGIQASLRMVSGRVLSLAEMGAVREHARHILRGLFVRGMIERHNKLRALQEPWDIENDPTDKYIRKKDGAT